MEMLPNKMSRIKVEERIRISPTRAERVVMAIIAIFMTALILYMYAGLP